MTDPRQPGSTDNWSSRYPVTYNGQNGQANGHYGRSGVNGYTQTDVDDLEGLGQDDEIGIPRNDSNGSNGSNERYWNAPQTLAPDYDEPGRSDSHYTDAETQQGLSAGNPYAANGAGSNGSAGSGAAGADPDATAWWNNAELASQSDPAPSGGEPWRSGEAASGPALGQQPAFNGGPEPESDWSSKLGYDSGATVATSAVTGSWAGSTSALDSSALDTDRSYPSSEGYSVGSVASAASAAESRTEAAGSARAEKGSNGPRRARLMLRHIDPLSTLKFTLVLTIAMFVVWMVAVGVLYGVLNGMGVFDKINNTINDVNGSDSDVVTAQIVFGAAAVIGAVNIVLFTALATVGSFIYNLCADMVGGLELTLAEHD